MIRNILAGLQQQQPQMMGGQVVGQMMPPQMPMMPQAPAQLDPYGQQVGGLKAALMGRFMNGF